MKILHFKQYNIVKILLAPQVGIEPTTLRFEV